jgi:iron complex transport system permease protein
VAEIKFNNLQGGTGPGGGMPGGQGQGSKGGEGVTCGKPGQGASMPAVQGPSVPGQKQAQTETEAVSVFGSTKPTQDTGPDYTYSKIRLHKKDEVNVYAAEQDARKAMDARLKKIIILAAATVVVFILACILPTGVFDRVPQERALSVLLAETVTGVKNFVGFFIDPNNMYGTYVLTVLCTLLAGAALALSGGIFQGALKNALASPSTLGVTQGGTVGAIIYTFFVYPNSATATYNGSASDLMDTLENMSFTESLLTYYGEFFCTFLGCAIVVVLIMLIAYIAGRGRVNNVALVVAGQVFTSLVALIVNWIRMWFVNHGDEASATYLAQTSSSSFTGAYTPTSVLMFAVPLFLCMGVCFALSRRMSLLAFDEDEARSMGISTTATRNLVVAVCTIMTALVVSFCGMIGFVGFMVPHIARKLVGPDFRYLLPACAVIGALLMCAVYYVSELGIPFLSSGSSGMLTSIVGCASFLVIALRGRRSQGAQWL